MAFKLNRSRKEPMSEINVTPFVDVMLVLLIIFMVTAPLLTVGVQVDLPESSADSLPEGQEPLTLSINSIDTIGGRSIGFFDKNGRLIAVIIINNTCKTEDVIILLFTLKLPFFVWLRN